MTRHHAPIELPPARRRSAPLRLRLRLRPPRAAPLRRQVTSSSRRAPTPPLTPSADLFRPHQHRLRRAGTGARPADAAPRRRASGLSGSDVAAPWRRCRPRTSGSASDPCPRAPRSVPAIRAPDATAAVGMMRGSRRCQSVVPRGQASEISEISER